jgi:hypothetical protein
MQLEKGFEYVEDEEKVDYYCRICVWWDTRFSGCPIRADSTVTRCRILIRGLGLLNPEFCVIMREAGAVTLRRIGEHIN